MNSLLLKFLSSADEPSSKRLGGMLCIIVGLLMKLFLLVCGFSQSKEIISNGLIKLTTSIEVISFDNLQRILSSNFDQFDGSADSVLLAGAALLGSTLFEKRNGIVKSDS